MNRKRITGKVLGLILLLLSFSIISYAVISTDKISTLGINTEQTLTGSTEPYPVDTVENRLTKLHFKNYAPYVTVYRFKVTPGQRYTLKTVFSGDTGYTNIEALGENPFSKSTSLLNYSGATSKIMGYSGAVDRLPTGYTQKSNFTVDKDSTGSYLYVIGHFETPSNTIKITLSTPAESDKSVTASQSNGAGIVYSLPIRLTKMPDETEQLKLKINSIDAFVNGEIEKLDVAPLIQNSSTMVPLRYIGEKLGAAIEWEPIEKKVTYTLGSKVIELWIGKDTALVNGQEKSLTSTPFIVNGHTLIPLRFVTEEFGASLQWFEKTQEILITY